jgi:hypothetical protein
VRFLTVVAPHVLRSRIRARRGDLDDAQRAWDKVPANAPIGKWASKQVALSNARARLAAAREDYGYAMYGLPKTPSKYPVNIKHAAVLGVLHQLYFDYKIPCDVGATAQGRVAAHLRRPQHSPDSTDVPPPVRRPAPCQPFNEGGALYVRVGVTRDTTV